MLRFKKLVSTLDSNKKLTTFKGITVTKGFLEGTMPLEDTVLYLESLGINGVFENLLMKAVFVPPGWRAEHTKSNKIYDQGMFIPVPERTWEEFVTAAESDRGDLWRVTEVGVVEEGYTDPQAAVHDEEYDSAVKRLTGEYDEQDLGILFRRMQSQIESIEDEEVKAQAVEELNTFIKDVHSMQQVELEKKKEEIFREAGVSLEDKSNIEQVIRAFHKSMSMKMNTRMGIISVKVTGAPGGTDSSDMHLGAFISAMEIAGNTEVLQKLSGVMTTSMSSGVPPVVSIPVSSMFPNSLGTTEEKRIYRDMVTTLNANFTEDNLVLSVSKIGHELSTLYSKNRKLPSSSIEVLEKRAQELEDNISNLIEELHSSVPSTSNTYTLEGLNTFQFAKSVRQFHRDLSSGNLAVQTFLDASGEFLDGNSLAATTLLDENFDFTVSLGGKTLTQFIKENPEDYRNKIKMALFATPIKPLVPSGRSRYDAMSAISTSVKNLFKVKLSSISGYKDTAAYRIFMSRDVVDNALQAVDRDPEKQAAFERALVSAISGHWDQVFQVKANFTKAMSDSIVASAMDIYKKTTGETLVPNSGTSKLSDSLFVSSKAGVREYFQKRPLYEDSIISDEVREGLSSLFMHGIYTSIPSSPYSDSDYDSTVRASSAISYFMGGNITGVDMKTGGYVYKGQDGDKYLHLRILSSARFLPPLSNTGYVWPKSGKDYIDSMIVASDPTLDRSELTDRDRLALISNMKNSDTMKPAFLALCNITASLQNVTQSDLSDSTLMITSRKQYETMIQVFDVDLSAEGNVGRMRGVNTHTKELLGSAGVDSKMVDRFFVGDIDANSPEFSQISLTALLDHVTPKSGSRTTEQRQQFVKNANSLIQKRLSGKLPANVISHFSEQVEKSALSGSTKSGSVSEGNLGHTYEFLANIPVLANHLTPGSRVTVLSPPPTERFTYAAMSGFSWKDEQGNTHTLGKTNGSNSGLMDNAHLILSADGEEIRVEGYEAKITKEGGTVAHLGNSTNLQRLLIDYYQKNSGTVKKVVMGEVATINAPWKPTDSKETSCASTEMNLYGGTKYVSAGVAPNSGTLVPGDYRPPTMSSGSPSSVITSASGKPRLIPTMSERIPKPEVGIHSGATRAPVTEPVPFSGPASQPPGKYVPYSGDFVEDEQKTYSGLTSWKERVNASIENFTNGEFSGLSDIKVPPSVLREVYVAGDRPEDGAFRAIMTHLTGKPYYSKDSPKEVKSKYPNMPMFYGYRPTSADEEVAFDDEVEEVATPTAPAAKAPKAEPKASAAVETAKPVAESGSFEDMEKKYNEVKEKYLDALDSDNSEEIASYEEEMKTAWASMEKMKQRS